MALDAVNNFAKADVSTGYNASATSIVLATGSGAKLPQPSTDGEFNLVWWDYVNYPDPSDDPNKEIVRCTARTTDTLTIIRAQELTSASTKNTGTYRVILGITAKIIDDLSKFVVIDVINETGSTITAGSVVYPSGVSSSYTTIGLAIASNKNKCRKVGIVDGDILNGATGKVVKLGQVDGVDTTGLSGVIYLSMTTPGGITNDMPTDGGYVVSVGAVKETGVSGSIIVDTSVSDLTVEVTDTNGFPTDQKTNTSISFDDSTRVFTIAPDGSSFHYYQAGDKYEQTTAQTVTLTAVEGLHVIYFEGDTLTSVANPSRYATTQLIINNSLVAYVYWDATNNVHNYFADERHGISMSPSTHLYLHFTRGAQYLSGLGLSEFVADGNASLNSHAQFKTDGGMTTDEDIPTFSSDIASTVGLPIYYLDGANANMRRSVNAGFSVLTTGTGMLAYNEWTGTVWKQTEVTSGNYVLAHVFALNGATGEDQQVSIMGHTQYSNIGLARAGATTEISDIVTQMPFQEIVPVGTVIYQTKSSYANAVKAKVVTDADGSDYVDWRTSELAQGASPTSHTNLTALHWTGSGHLDTADSFAHFGTTGDAEAITVAETKTALSINNVDNTSDTNKPISTATQTALDGKATSLGADDNYVTDAQLTVIGNTSGTNTGDQDLSGYLEDIVDDTTPQLGGELDAQAHTIGFTNQTATGDGTTTINWKLGNKFKFTFGAANETFTFTAPTKPCNLLLWMKQDGTGSRTATFPSTVKWAGGNAPTLTTAANGIDIVSLYFDGTDYYSVASLKFS